MTITSKAVLADELGVTRGRISQYIRDGLPVRPDGKLNREQALNWIDANCRAPQHGDDRGANRARSLVGEMKRREARRQPPPKSSDNAAATVDLAHRIAAELIARSGRIAGTVAVELGLPTTVAYALDQGLTVHLWTAAERALGLTAAEEVAFEQLVDQRLQANSVDWLKLAMDRGEDADDDALEAALNKLDSLNPDGDLLALPLASTATAERADAIERGFQ